MSMVVEHLDDKEVVVHVTCDLCKHKTYYKDETKEDCWWQMSIDDWEEDYNHRDICPKCADERAEKAGAENVGRN